MVERIVGHNYRAYPCQLEHIEYVNSEIAIMEKLPCFGQIGASGGKPKCLQNSNDAASSFRNRIIFDKQGAPDCVRLFLFRKAPILLRCDLGRAEKLSFQIVVRKKFVNPP